MTLKQAEQIIKIYGNYIALQHSKLAMYFPMYIPKLFLPYPKDTIYVALDLAASKSTSPSYIKLCHEVASILVMYVDEEKALWEEQRFIHQNLMQAEFKDLRKTQAVEWIKENYANDPPYHIK